MKIVYTALAVSALCLFPISFVKVHASEKNVIEEKAGNKEAPPPPLEIDHPNMMDRMVFKLGLTKEQKQKINSIRRAKREKAEALHNDQKTKLVALQNALKNGTDDEVRQAFIALQAANQSISALHLEGMLETRTLLTPEQRNTFAGMSVHHLGGHGRGRRK